jgi:hypothetical protein
LQVKRLSSQEDLLCINYTSACTIYYQRIENGMKNAEKRHTFLEMCGKAKKAKFGKFEMIFLIFKT